MPPNFPTVFNHTGNTKRPHTSTPTPSTVSGVNCSVLCDATGSTSDHALVQASQQVNSSCTGDAESSHEEVNHIVMIPIVIIIFITNIVVIVHSARSGRFRHPGNWFIAALYIADILVGVTSIGTNVTSTYETSLDLCLLRLGLLLAAIVSSIVFLLLIAIDRFLAITRALTYATLMTSRVVMVAILVTVAACLLMGMAPLAGWTHYHYSSHCSFAYVLDPSYIVFILVGSLIPISVILVIYLYLYNKARLHIRKIEAVNALHHIRAGSWPLGVSSKGWRCIRQLAILVGCLLVTWAPFIIASIVDISSDGTPCWLKDVIGTHLLLLGMTNSILNPLVYTVGTRDFRTSCRQFLVKQRCWKFKDMTPSHVS